MTSLHNQSCDPLRIFNRLEPRPRRERLDAVLRAEVHDPLWMLCRQWQFGELRGEDGGSAIKARVAQRITRIAHINRRDGDWHPFDGAVPLEAQAEALEVRPDPHSRALLGRHWLRILATHGERHNRAGREPSYDGPTYRARFARAFPIETADPGDEGADGILARARRRAHAGQHLQLSVLAGKAVDGIALVSALPPEELVWERLPAGLRQVFDPGHELLAVDALTDFRTRMERLHVLPPVNERDGAWDGSRLEYRFGCHLPHAEATGLTAAATHYPGGKLDWYHFDVEHGRDTPGGASPAQSQVETRTMLPTQVVYPGMPNARWWAFEDARVDLADFHADPSDVVKLVVAEFALLHGNDWLVVPCSQPVGSLGEVLGVLVSDTFGHHTLVRASTGQATDDWSRWEWFRLSPGSRAAPRLGEHLWLPPTLPKVLDGEAIEEVGLVRDEMNNTVWGIERRVPDGLGRSVDGADAARRLKNAIESELTELGASSPGSDDGGDDSAGLRYTLAAEVGENWIPFLPVQIPGGQRAIRLQRASLPRFLAGTVRPIRPLTGILRPGLQPDDQQSAPYYLYEEEVPRAGVTVRSCYQRARWFGGRSALWIGRKKLVGRGEATSGLLFDLIETRD